MALHEIRPVTLASGTPAIAGELEGAARSGPFLQRPEDGCAFVIFGASGDLTAPQAGAGAVQPVMPGVASSRLRRHRIRPDAHDGCQLPSSDGAEREALA